jgi:iron complex outermembrane receptor protein
MLSKITKTTLLAALLSSAQLPAQAQNEGVDEVVVTTTRTPSLRLDNPGNIATIDPSESLSLFPVELLNTAPGVHIHRGSGQEHLTAIRSPVLVGGAGAGSFLYLEDGIPMRAPGFANVNALMDAHPQNDGSVEIVRGPGSALYGSNAVHGLINFIAAPLEDGARSFDVAAGSYGRHALGLMSSQAHEGFTSRVTLDLNGEEDGYRDEQSFSQQKVRVESAWEKAGTDYRFSLSAMNLNQETAGYIAAKDDLFLPVGGSFEARQDWEQAVAALPAACQAVNGPAYDNEACAKSNPNENAFRDAKAYRTYLRMTRKLDDGATLTLTPYARSNDMTFRMHFLPLTASTTIEENSHASVGLQTAYARSTSGVDYVAGIDVELTKGELTETQTGADAYGTKYPQGTHYDFEVDAQVIAPYFHAVWALGDKTKLTTGLRLELTDYDYANNATDSDNTDALVTGDFLFRPASRSDDFSDVSPKIGLVHELADNRRVFANLARAARAPQVTDLYRLRDNSRFSGGNDGLNPDVSAIDSEILDSLEVGYRAIYPAASYELAAFVMQKENYHFRDANDFYETNGETDHYGLELNIKWLMSDNLELASNLTYAKHEYAFNRDVEGNNPAETITDSNTIDGAPETLGYSKLTYTFNARLDTSLTWEHVGDYFMDASNSAEYEGHDIFGLGIDYMLSGDSAVSLRVDNLLDDGYATRADKWFGDNRYFPGEGRRLMVRFTRDY